MEINLKHLFMKWAGEVANQEYKQENFYFLSNLSLASKISRE